MRSRSEVICADTQQLSKLPGNALHTSTHALLESYSGSLKQFRCSGQALTKVDESRFLPLLTHTEMRAVLSHPDCSSDKVEYPTHVLPNNLLQYGGLMIPNHTKHGLRRKQ
nr:hypothetical protein CFP56_28644 [Quercus suber]